MAYVFVSAFSRVISAVVAPDKISIDNWCFKLFYRITPMILGVSTVLVCCSQLFGEPISCDAGIARDGVELTVLQSYCWMYSTTKIPTQYKGACSGGEQNDGNSSIVYNTYYQWVPLYLIFMAFLFYLPRMWWLNIEGGLMKFLCKGTTTRSVEDADEKRLKLILFFSKNIHNKYNIYFAGFVFCELLNFLMVVLLIGLTHRFLHFHFVAYGFEVWQYYLLPEEEQRMPGVKNPMCNAFPRIASCDYWRYGAGGRQENINAICILNLNIINDKVFLILWWWFYLIALLSCIRVVYRCLQCRSAWLRFKLLDIRLHRYFKRSTKLEFIRKFVCQCKIGDWFILYQLSKNLNRPFFIEFLTEVSVKFANNGLSELELDPELNPDTGDNILTMLLKPSYTTQDSGNTQVDNHDQVYHEDEGG